MGKQGKMRGGRGMGFDKVIVGLKLGNQYCREGWNGADMFIYLVQGSATTAEYPPLLGIYLKGTKVDHLPHIDMKTATGEHVPWLASQTDMLANDWLELTLY